jgi:hypothetical protein
MTLEYAHAGNKKPPKSYLRDGDRRLQRGKLGSYCWVTGNQGVCADALPSWPKAARVGADEKLRIRFRKKQKPTGLSLTAYKKVKKNGIPKGEGRELDHKLNRVKRDGETIGWKAIFSLAKRGRHYYISAFARWDEGDASYFFHARTRRS